MRFALVGFVALTLTGGCWRFGYELEHKPAVHKPDAAAAAPDASSPALPDAALRDAGSTPRDASVLDASQAYEGDAAAQRDAAADAALDAATGGAPQDAASAGAASPVPQDAGAVTDAGTGGSASSDPCLGRSELAFCNGFEDSSGWSAPTQINGTLTRSTDQARSGSSSLHASTGPSSSGKVVRQQTEVYAQQKSGDVWARAFYYLPSTTTIDAASVLATMRIAEAASPYFGCAVAIRSDLVELAGVATRFRTLAPFPRDRWTCVELHIRIDDSTGICEVYVDMTTVAQSAQLDTLPASGYSTLSVGVEFSNAAQESVDLYIDDVAASTARIYCD